MNKPPTWFYLIAALALLWNLAGCTAFVADLQLTPEDLARLPEAQQALYRERPLWALVATGVAVIGGALDAWMMVPGWVRGQSDPKAMNCSLEVMIDHLDHICQIAGNALHIGIGSDLDGAFGREQCPYDLETIADLQKIPGMLKKRGYTDIDIENVMHRNWLRFLRRALQ